MAFDPSTARLDGFDPSTATLDGIGAKPKKRSIGDITGDIGVTALKSAVGLPQSIVGLADIPTGGRVGKALEGIGYRPAETQKTLDSLYSEPQQAANKAVREAEGFVPTLKAAVQNPSTILTTLGESAAQIVGGAGIARGVMKVAPKIPAWAAGAIGEGAIGAGSAAENIRAQSEDGLLTPKQSLAAAGSGIGTAVFGAAGGKLAQRFGLGDVDTMLAQGGPSAAAAGAAKQGFLKQVAGSGIAEGVFEELPQSIQEQMWQNYATGKPLTEGVGNAAAMGLLAGTALGGVSGGYNALARQPEAVTPPPADTPISGLLANPAATGTPADQVIAADVERANAVAAAQANADALYKSRDEYEAEQQRINPQPNPANGDAFTPEEIGAFRQEQSANQITLARDLEIRRTMDNEAKAQLGIGALGRAAAAGIDSGAITAEQVLQPSTGVNNGATGSDATVLAQASGQGRSGIGGQGVSDVLDQPVGSGPGVGADAVGTVAGVQADLPVPDKNGGTDAVINKPITVNGSANKGPSAADMAAASRGPLAGGLTKKTEGVSLPDGVQSVGYAALNEVSPPAGTRPILSISGNKSQIDNKPAATPAAARPADSLSTAPDNNPTPIARVGTTPNNAEPITVKDGVVYMGKFPAQHFETGEDIRVGENADFAQVKKALQDGKALTSKQRVYPGVFGSKAKQDQPDDAVSTSADISGNKIDGDWTAFDKSSGTLGINRAEMPQIKSEHRGAMVNFLSARGITSEQDEVSPDTLKATQREFSRAKVEKAKGFTGNDRSILVSSDGYVLDGHHQWLAKREAGKPVKVIRLNAPIKTLLDDVKAFPSAQTDSGLTKPPSKLKAMIDARLADKEIRGLLPEFAKLSGWSERGGSILRDANTGEVTGRTKWIPRADWWTGKPNSVTERLIRSGVPKALNAQPITKPEREAVDWLLSVIEADIAEMNRESVAIANEFADDADDIPFDNLVGETDPRKQMEALGFSEDEINETIEAEGRKTDEVAARTAQKSNQPGNETQAAEAGKGEVDRRQDTTQRKKIADLTPDEMRRELLIDAMTGLGNRRAYQESDKLATQVSIDADGLKWINDNLGHESGDRLLETIGKVIAEETTNGFHISGDEYVIQTHTKDEADAIMARVVERLNGVTIESTTTGGEVITMRGIGISYGVNGDLNNAEKALREHKAQREREGLRGGRGTIPPNAVIGKQGGQDQQDNNPAQEEALTYTPPITTKEASERWDRGTERGANQNALFAAVGKALDAKLFYNRDVNKFVAQELGVTEEQQAVGADKVEGGAFGYDVYLGRKAVEAERYNAAEQKLSKELGLKVGENIGKLKLQDGKIASAATIESLGDTSVVLVAKRGPQSIRVTMGYSGLVENADRAGNDRFKAKPSENNPPTLELTGQTPAEIAAAEAASKKAAEKSARDDAKPTGPDVTADQVDLFNTQGGLFNQPAPKNEFVKAPDGSIDFGEITAEQSGAIKRQAGKIRLEQGVQNADGSGNGLAHIEARHGKEIRSSGYNSIESFVSDAVRHIDAIWKPGKTSQLIAVQAGNKGKVTFIELQPARDADGDYYRVNSAFPATDSYINRKEKNEGWKSLWSRDPVSANASGASGFVDQAPNAGETTPTVSPQSDAGNIAPDADQGKAVQLTPSSEAVNTEDSGAELSYNLRNRRATGLKWEDLADKEAALRVSEVTKAKVYPKPDYAALAEKTDPVTAHLLKQLYDSIATTPVTKRGLVLTDVDLKTYIAEVNRIMDAAMGWSDKVSYASQFRPEADGKSLLETVYPDGWQRSRDEVILLGGNKLLGALQPSREEMARANKAIAKGWPGKIEAWQTQGFKIVESSTIKVRSSGVGDQHYVEVDGRYQRSYPNKAEADAAIEGLDPWLLLNKRGSIVSQHDTQEAAIEAARAATKRDSKNPQVSDKGIAVTAAERSGNQHRLEGEDIDSDRLRSTFGFKGVNFGTWMKGKANEAERQLHLNHAYDSFMDLAEVLDVPPKAISLNGMLGLAIGAQGRGGAAAHFVPGVNEINLTRGAGAGSLAHEFGHALDHYFARLGGLDREKTPFLTEHTGKPSGGELRPEIMAKFQAIVKVMNTRVQTRPEYIAGIEKRIQTLTKNVDGWLKHIRRDFTEVPIQRVLPADAAINREKALTKLDEISARIRAGNVGDGKIAVGSRSSLSPAVAEIAELFKGTFGRKIGDAATSLQSNLDALSSANERLNAAETHEPQLMVSTDYAANAAKLDQGKNKAYWSTNLEKFARAFDAYVSDAMEAKAAKNTYLSHAGRTGETVPTGNERTAINQAFAELVSTIDTKETGTGTAMFSRSADARADYERRIDGLFNGEPPVRVGALVLDRSDVLDMLGIGDKPVRVAEHKVIASGINHGLTADHWKKIPEWLDNPAAVFDSDTVPGRLVFIAPEFVKGAPVRMIVEPDVVVGEIMVNLLVNAYDAQGRTPLRRWVDSGLTRYIDKAKSRQLLATSGLQLPGVLQKASGSKRKIYTDTDLVKYRSARTEFSRATPESNSANINGTSPTVNEANRGKTNSLERAISRDGDLITVTPVASPSEMLDDAAGNGGGRDADARRTQAAHFSAAENIAGLFGKKIIPVLAEGDFAINGVINRVDPDSIFIDVRTNVPAHIVMGHELSHHIEIDSPKLYAELMDAISGMLVGHAEYRTLFGIPSKASDNAVNKEMVGDLLGDSFTHPEFWDMVGAQNPSLLRRIADTVTKWLNRLILKSTGKGYASERWVTDAREARKILAQAVAKYAKKSNPEPGAAEAMFERVYSRAQDSDAVMQPDGTYADPYQTIEVRPNTTPTQLSAGRAALNDAEKRILGQNAEGFELLGSNISADFRAKGGTSLVGKEVSGPEDLAFAAQVLRDPRFETFRVFYTDAAGKIVGERAYSSRLAGAVYLPENHAAQIHIDMRVHGAAGYWLMHNHPSGSATESRADLNLTARIAKETPGFKGHVVIDHNEYNHISVQNGTAVPRLVRAPQLASIDLNANPEKPHALLGEAVSGPAALATIAKRLQTKDGYVVLIGTNGQQRISLLTEVPAAYLKGIRGNKLKGLRAVAAIKRATGETGSINLFAAVTGDVLDYGILLDSGILRDVVSMSNGESAASNGLLNWKGVPVSNVARSGGKGYVAQPATPYRTNEPVWSAPTPARMDTFLYEAQDKHIDTKRVIESIKTKINDLADEFNTYVKEALYHGRADKRTKDFLTDELTPLVDAMAKADVTQAQLNEYLHARHAIERNRVMRERNPDREDNADLSGMSDDRANEILKKAPLKLAVLARRVDAIVAKSRQELVNYGLETQETVDAWSSLYKHYVPLKREGFDDTAGTGQGFSVRGSSTKEAMGSHRAVDNIFANIAMQRERNITRGEKNRVALSLYGLAKTNPNAGFWKLDRPAQITQINPDTGLPEVVPGNMADYKVPMVSYIGKDGTVQMRVDPAYKGRDNVVTVRINGVDRAVIFNESDPRALRMAESLKNLDMDQLGEVIGSVGRVTRYIAAVNTQYNPVFGVTNLLRDVQTAMLNLQSTPLNGKQRDVMKEALGALKGIYQDARAVRHGKHPDSEYAKDWEEFQRVGGQTGYRDMFRTAKDRAAAIEHMLDPAWWQKTYAGKLLTLNGVLAKPEQMLFNSVGKHLFRWLEDYNTAMENAMRLAAYRVGKRNGMSQEAAAFLAKSLTVNFNKKGRVATQAGALYAFFNASAQGTARIAETLRHGAKPGEMLGKTGKAIITGGITLGAMQALMLLAAGFDEDEPPEFVRERNLIIPAPDTDKGYITIPMPLGFHVLPNIGRVLVEGSVYGKPLDRMADLMLTLFEAFNPIGTGASLAQTISPTVADPIVALSENKDWTGKRIFREDFSQLDPTPGFTRTKDNASILAKGLAYGINAVTGGSDYTPGRFSPTPDQIDYLIGQATGGVGREVTKAATTAGALISGEELPMYKVPLVGRLIGSAGGTAGVRDKFYDNLRTLNLHEAEIQGRRDKREPVLDYIADHPEARLAKYAGRVESKIREKKRLSRQAKEDGRDSRLIDAQIVNMMQQLNERVDGANP